MPTVKTALAIGMSLYLFKFGLARIVAIHADQNGRVYDIVTAAGPEMYLSERYVERITHVKE